MKISQASILISPGYGAVQDDHWCQRWARQMSTAQTIQHDDMTNPRREDWVTDIVKAVEAAERPVVLVGHSLGCIAIAHAAPVLPKGKVAGAFLVAPSDWDRKDIVPGFDDHDFAPIPRERLPCPVQLVASRNDPYCDFAKSLDLTADWGAKLIDAGDAGHINVESGQGPWPEGLTAFALFMKTL